MTARSNESTKEVLTGRQLLEEIVLNWERKLAKKLGNSERLEKWRKVKFFAAARREWLGAWKRFQKGKGLDCLSEIRAGVQRTLGPEKAFTLASLRLTKRPDEIVRKSATVIGVAAKEGDARFLKQLGQVLISRERTKPCDASLSYDVLCYWFAGNLWLMNEKQGWGALCHYTKRDITKAAYRSACRRLGLKGYKDRMRSPPVLGYDQRTGSYEYAAQWS